MAFRIGSSYHKKGRDPKYSIRKDKVDLKAKRISLPGRTTQNGKPRYLPIYGDVTAELDMWLANIKNSDCPIPIQDQGQAVLDFEKALATACKAAGIPGTLTGRRFPPRIDLADGALCGHLGAAHCLRHAVAGRTKTAASAVPSHDREGVVRWALCHGTGPACPSLRARVSKRMNARLPPRRRDIPLNPASIPAAG